MRLSIIVPTLNEAAVIAETLRRARQAGVEEVIVVDGGSADGTAELAQPLADRVVTSGRGRAVQMNAGARQASGDVLLFLHADTILPQGFAAAVEQSLMDPATAGGRFDVELIPSSPLLGLVAALINLRSRLSKMSTGDQAMFLRRDVLERLGGFAEIALCEDLELSRRLKRVGRVACLREKAMTSSRRWIADGPLRTILRMWTIRFLYSLGVAPERLKRAYVDRR